MGSKSRKNKKKNINLSGQNIGEGISPSPSDFVSLKAPEDGYFLGFKILRYNELWKWSGDLEDVKF